MGTTNELTWGGLRIRSESLDMQTRRTTRHDPPLVQVYGYTKTEQARVMTLTKRELVALLVDAARALQTIEDNERRHRTEVINAIQNELPREQWERLLRELPR